MPAYCFALDEPRFGKALAAIILPACHVAGPAYDSTHHRAPVPVEVGDRGLAPYEARVVIGADQRDVLRYSEAPPGKIVVGSVVEIRFVEDESGGRGWAEQRIEGAFEAFLALLPIGNIELSGGDTGGFKFVKESSETTSGLW